MSITKKPASSAASTDAIDRPFAASVLAEARRLANEYQVTIWFDKDEGGWCGRCVELPLCMGFGTNPTKCLKSAREIIETTVAVMIEDGEAVPLPETAAAQRTEQINVRLTKSEKRLFEEMARRGGFGGVSDFVRSTALVASADRVSQGGAARRKGR